MTTCGVSQLFLTAIFRVAALNGLLTIATQIVCMWRMIILGLTLVACNTPSPHFRGSPVTRVTVDGSVFDVRVRDNLAEALRVNPQYAPRFGPIRGRAGFAMAQVSGCRILEVRGDQALATGILACEGRPPDWIVPTAAVSYSCLEVGQWASEGLGVDFTEFECDPG
jgi:hypothetical protein